MKVIGHDDAGEPIWQLTEEEFAAIKAQRRQAKSNPPAQAPTAQPASRAADSEFTEAGAQNPQALELGSRIWAMRKRGLSVYEIHRREGIPMEAVKEILAGFERTFYPDAGAAIASRLALDDQRLDDLFRTWLPIATGGPVEVTRTDRKGRSHTEFDSDTPLKAAGIVLTAIQRRIQIAIACRPEGGAVNGKDGASSTNILLWLQTVMPGISKVVQQANGNAVPRQKLVLECEAEKLAVDANGANRSDNR
jgi:hypothetical protein